MPDNLPTNEARKGKNARSSEHKENTKDKQEDDEGGEIVNQSKPKEGHGIEQEAEDEGYSAFGQLVLPLGHKRMVKSLVAQHFRDKESQEERKADIVSGKGEINLVVWDNLG